ncbi:unnamed protein product, partial [marine sediment metagenome]
MGKLVTNFKVLNRDALIKKATELEQELEMRKGQIVASQEHIDTVEAE